jgi:hypothetical protein
MKSNKVQYNHKIAQTDQTPLQKKIEEEKKLYSTLLEQAKSYKAEYPNNARSNFMAEYSEEFGNLNAGHRQNIEQILPGKPSNYSPSNSGSTGSGFNNAKSQAKSYEPYLQKINDSTDGNNLLYLAAISSFGFPKIPGEDVKRLYTEKNEERIKSRLYQITSNHYIQTKFPNIPKQLSDAIQRLEEKVKGSSSTGSSGESSNGSSKPTTDTVPAPGSGRPTNNPYPPSDIGEFPKTQPDTFNPDEDNFSNEAKTIIDQIKDLEKLADSSKDAFKEQWIGSYENILSQLQIATSNNKINIAEDSYIKTKLTNLDNKWVEIFYPGGFKRVGTGTIIPLDVKDAKATLLEQIKINKDPEQVKKLANIFQKVYLNGKSTQDKELYSYLKEINNAISIRNGDDKFEENIPTISMSEYRK